MRTATRAILAIPAGGLAALTALAVGAAPASAAAAPSALWHMGESPGSTVMADSSGNGNNGSIGPNVTLGEPGYSGSAYGFDGSGLITVPDSSTLNPGTHRLTISAWLQVPAGLPTGDYNFLQKGTATAKGGAYKLEINGHNGHLGAPECAFNGASGAHARVQAKTSIADGQWHHVVCVLRAHRAVIYVDGNRDRAVRNGVGTISNTKPVSVGAKPNHSHGYVGLADEVSITIG